MSKLFKGKASLKNLESYLQFEYQMEKLVRLCRLLKRANLRVDDILTAFPVIGNPY